MAEVNWLVDNLIWVYGIAVLTVIISVWLFRGANNEPDSYPRGMRKTSDAAQNDDKHGNDGSAPDWEKHFLTYMQGQWGQVEAENLDNFGLLSNQSKIRRTLGSLAFYRVRHRIRYQRLPLTSDKDTGAEQSERGREREREMGVCASECSGGPDVLPLVPEDMRFCLLRDLGEGMQEWSLEAVMGSSRDTAVPVEVRVDTPGYEKLYRYRVWVRLTA